MDDLTTLHIAVTKNKSQRKNAKQCLRRIPFCASGLASRPCPLRPNQGQARRGTIRPSGGKCFFLVPL